ncbi:MAG: class I SAM-dependent methyltransferase [Nitrospirae bacterium]|nr:class I SAM-dependent methyltransferase [Nitrospirota bacterium]
MPEKKTEVLSIRKGWEEAAPAYREGFALHLEEISRHLSEILPAPLPTPVLDLACGPGTAMAALDRRHSPRPSVGCDFSRRMLGFARERIRGSHGVVADQDLLPFAPESFGTVISSMGTIFSRNPEDQLHAIARLLKPGGVFAFSAWGSPSETAMGAVSRRIVESWPHPYEGAVPPLESPFSPGHSAWIDRVAGESGFEIREVSSRWLVFRFDDSFSAAKAILGTGRLALLLGGRKELEEELLSHAMGAFAPHRDPKTGRIEVANRYHLFLLSRRRP